MYVHKYALYFVGVEAEKNRLQFLLITGVSYYEDGTSCGTDDWRWFASVMAASCTAHFIKNYVPESTISLEGQ